MIDTTLIKELGGEIFGDFDPSKITDVHNIYQEITPGSLFVAIQGTKQDGANFVHQAIARGAIAVLTSRKLEVSIPQIIVENVLLFIARYATKARQRFTNPMIAIVGSVGKTTLRHTLVSALPGKKLYTRKSFNIKSSVSMALMLLDNSYDFAIVEIGTNFPGEVVDLARIVQPDYSLITTIGMEHVEFLEDLSGVLKEEYSILQYTQKIGISALENQVLLKEHNLEGLLTLCPKHLFVPDFEKNDNFISFKIEDQLISLENYSKSRGLIYASVFTIFVAHMLKLNLNAVISKIKDIHCVCRRGSIIKIGNLTIHDFSYNSNPTSLDNLFKNIEEPCIFIFGEMKELGAHSFEQHQQALQIIFDHQFIDKCYVVGNIDIPQRFSSKIQPYTENILDNLNGHVYFQGSKSMLLDEIIFKLMNLKFPLKFNNNNHFNLAQ